MKRISDKRLLSNIVYNVIYHVSLVLIPLITTPYIARVLGSEKTGVYSYTYAQVMWFVVFAKFGYDNYGSRQVAMIRDNQKQLNKTFSELYLMQLVTSIIALIGYSVYLVFFCTKYKTESLISGVYIVSAMLNIGWLYYGLEKFKIIVMRTMIIRFIATACIFIFIRSKEDTWKYVFILAMMPFINAIILWCYRRKNVSFVCVDLQGVLRHLKGCAILFVPVILIDIYRLMDKTMLGHINMMSEIGYYTYADRIAELPYTIIAAVGTVMVPRMTNMIASGKREKSFELIETTFMYNTIAASAIVFGLIAVRKDLVHAFLGEGYAPTATLLAIVAPMILIRAWANVIRTQYLMPNQMDSSYVSSLVVGVVLNLVLNSLLIPKYGAIGAAIATLVAESSVAAVQIWAGRKEIPIYQYIRDNAIFIVFGIIMLVVVSLTSKIWQGSVIMLVVNILIGAVIYIFLIALFYLVRRRRIKD